MAAQAQVTSIEALEAFRAGLLVYLSKARPTLEAVQAEIARTRAWVQTEQRTHWEHQVRRRTRELQEAQQALFSAQLSGLREATDAEQMAVQQAKRALEQAEAKLKTVKRWSREYDARVGPPAKQLEQLRDLLTQDLPRAVAFLAQAVKTLDAYAQVGPGPGPAEPGAGGAPAPSAGEGAPDGAPGGLPALGTSGGAP